MQCKILFLFDHVKTLCEAIAKQIRILENRLDKAGLADRKSRQKLAEAMLGTACVAGSLW